MAKLYETLRSETAERVSLFDAVIACYGPGSVASNRVREVIRVFFAKRSPAGGIVQFSDHPDTTLDDMLWVCHVADV